MTTSSPAPASKICIRCKQDCSTRPRTKDERGRYTCRACLDAAAPAAAPHPDPQPALGYSLADDLPAAPAHAPAGGPCPECGHFLKTSTIVCLHCGYNTRTGQAGSIRTVTEIVDDDTPADRRRRAAAKATRVEYAKALILAATGGIIGCALVGNAYGPAAIAGYLVVLAAYTVIAAVVYIGCCLSWVGFDASLPLSLVRILAVCTIVVMAAVLLSNVPFFIGRTIAIGLLYAFTLSRLVDLDRDDAIMIGVITIVAWTITGFILIAAVMGHH